MTMMMMMCAHSCALSRYRSAPCHGVFFSIDDGTSIMWFVSIGIKLLVIDNAILGFCKNLSEQFCWKYSWQTDDVHACALV